MPKRVSNVDKMIGRNIRIYRLARGLSQTALADQLGLTFQQIQKYEKGTNRIGSGRIVEISRVLKVKLLALFEGVDFDEGESKRPEEGHVMLDLLANPQSFRLVQAFSKISDPVMRKVVVDLVNRLSDRKER